jgi:hypothetical protein
MNLAFCAQTLIASFAGAVHRSMRPQGGSLPRSLILGAALGASLGIPFGLLQVGTLGSLG